MLRSAAAIALVSLLAACNGRRAEPTAGAPVNATPPDGSGAAPVGAGSTGTTMSNVTIAATVTATHPGRPPLERLTVDLAIDNRSNAAHWILIPKQIPKDPDDGDVLGVDSVELRGKGPGVLGSFRGTGGVHALRVAAHAKVIVTNVPIGWWRSNPQDPVPALDITIADELTIGGKPAKDWFGVEPLLESGARIDAASDTSGSHAHEKGEAPIALTNVQATTAALTLPRAVTAVEPYRVPADHLREELRRVWLRVEYEIRLTWARRGAARPDDATEAMPVVGPETVGELFAAAAAEWSGTPTTGDNRDAELAMERWLAHHERVEARTAVTLAGPAAQAPPLLRVRGLFGLSPRQWASLMFALAPEVDPDLVTAYRYLARDATCRGLDGRLLAHLVYDTPDARSLLARDLGPGSPLVQYRLVEVQAASESLLFRRIRPAGRLVQLADGGQVTLDPELSEIAEWRAGRVDGMFPAATLRTAAAALRSPEVIVAIQGQRGVGKRLLLQLAAAQSGRSVLLIDGRRLSREGAGSLALKSIVRELVILGAVPVFADVDDIGTTDFERDELAPCITALLGEWDGPLAITVNRERMPRVTQRPVVHLPLEVPPLDIRTAMWTVIVPSLPRADAASLSGRFAIPGGVIVSAAQAATAGRQAADGPPDVGSLERSVADQLHQRLQRLGKKLDTPHQLEDLIVDDDVRDALMEIQAAVRERRRVRAEWGLRGAHGISVLLSGHPGVGKTMAGTVLARRLGLDIYEVDLSQVVSKWLGETEKNLSDVFDAAEPGHVVLLFNEADSLFGKRTADVKSSNDRYANLETNYLLARLERFGGLAILTTNLSSAIDQAFKRRFTYDVFFSFPSPEMRAELWRRTLPVKARSDEIDFDDLAERYELSGGFIKVACERAAYMAGAAGQSISSELLRHTIDRMYRERGKLSSVGPLD